MIFPCVVKDKFGKVTRKYSSKQLSKRYWKCFDPKGRFIDNRQGFSRPKINRYMPASQDFYHEDYDYNFYSN